MKQNGGGGKLALLLLALVTFFSLTARALTPGPCALALDTEKMLTAVFQKRDFATVENNPYGGQSASYFVTFNNSNVRGFLRKSALHDFPPELNKFPQGERARIAEGSVYQVSKRTGFDIYPLTVGFTLPAGDPILKLNPNLEPGEYVLLLFYSGYRGLRYEKADWQSTEEDEIYGEVRHKFPLFVRAQLFDWLIGDGDGLDILVNPATLSFIAVDGAQGFVSDRLDEVLLFGQIPFGRAHYLNDREFYDHLASLNPNDVFRGLEVQRNVGTPPRHDLFIRYGAAKRRLIELQNRIRELQH